MYLSAIYPSRTFSLSQKASGDHVIYLGVCDKLAELGVKESVMADQNDDFRISHLENTGFITSGNSLGVLQGVYALAEKLGYSYRFDGDVLSQSQEVFSFNSWDFADRFLAEERTVFNWHNFLSGCTGWDFPPWQQFMWILAPPLRN